MTWDPRGKGRLEAAYQRGVKARLRVLALFVSDAGLPEHLRVLAEALSEQEAMALGADTLTDLLNAICGNDDQARLVLARRIAVLYGPEALNGRL